MNGSPNGFTAELENALTCAEILAVDASTEIIKQEWPKIKQSFGQLIGDGESDMKVVIDLFLTEATEGIGVKAGMTYKIVRKARVGEVFARFDGTVQPMLPIPGLNADGTDTEDSGAVHVDLSVTAVEFGFVTVGGEPDVDAMLTAAKGVFTEHCRNSSFLLTKQIGCTLDAAQEIMRTLHERGELDPAYETASTVGVDVDALPEAGAPDATQEQTAGADANAATPPDATPWADTPEEAEAMLDRAMSILDGASKPRVATLQRKLKLPVHKAQALFDAVQAKMEAAKSAADGSDQPDGDAVPPSIVERCCVDCAQFDACAVAKPNEQSVTCDGFTARDGAV
jgi:hypothetical protein